MSEHPTSGQAAETTRAVYTGDQPNPVLHFLQRPRIMLMLLAFWSILGVLTQVFTSSSLFFDNHDQEIDGALAGFALGFEGIPLAAVYIYAIKDPLQHRPVYLLALIHMASLAASQVYHLGTGDYSFESIIVPLFGSAGIGALVFLHLFAPKEHAPTTTPAET